MTELEALYERHSVRNYQDKKIEEEKLAELRELIEECNRVGSLHLQLLEEAGGTFKRLLNRFMGLSTAPSVIACVGPDDENLDERIGYYGQKIVLKAQMLGLNTCWAGTFQPHGVKAEILPGEKLPIVIAIGYGVTPGKARKTKSAEQVVKGGMEDKPEWFVNGVKAALAAPTAINQQRFELVLTEDRDVKVIDKGGVLSKIDQGIVRYNFEVGSRLLEKM